MIKTLLLFISIATPLHLHRCNDDQNANPYEGQLRYIGSNITELRLNHKRTMRAFFYDKKIANDPVLRYLVAHLAKCESILYAARRAGMDQADTMLREYFIHTTKPMNPMLVANEHLAEVFVQRLIAGSIEDGLYKMEQCRKKSYLLLTRSELYHDLKGAMIRALEHFARIASTEAAETAAQRAAELALEKYIEQGQSLPETDFVMLFMAIDEMISCEPAPTDSEQLVTSYVGQKLRTDIMNATLLMKGVIGRFSPDQIDSVDMNDVLFYEDKVIEAFDRVDRYTTEFELRLIQLDSTFRDAMQAMFYQRKQLSDELNDLPLLAVASQVARLEALMYADERRMLIILRNLSIISREEFARIYVADRNMIDLLETSLVRYVVEQHLRSSARLVRDRKCLYLLLCKFGTDSSSQSSSRCKQLAVEHFRRTLQREARATELGEQCRSIRRRVQMVLPGGAQRIFDDLEAAARAEWRKDSAERRLSYNIDPHLLMDIKEAKIQSYNKLLRPPNIVVDRVTHSDMVDYEDRLLALAGNNSRA